MNKDTFTTYREPQIERFPRFSGFSVEVSGTFEHFSFMKSPMVSLQCAENAAVCKERGGTAKQFPVQ